MSRLPDVDILCAEDCGRSAAGSPAAGPRGEITSYKIEKK